MAVCNKCGVDLTEQNAHLRQASKNKLQPHCIIHNHFNNQHYKNKSKKTQHRDYIEESGQIELKLWSVL